MIRQIIHIDQEKCNGCGLCATACHEGAIEMVNGKAQLVREHFCDGLGDCLPGCPTGAITFEQREAPAYDEAAVQQAKAEKQAPPAPQPSRRGLPRLPDDAVQRRRGSRPRPRRRCKAGVPAGPVAGADQADPGPGSLLPGGQAAGGRRLRRLCLRLLP